MKGMGIGGWIRRRFGSPSPPEPAIDAPFPDDWLRILESRVGFYRRIPDEDRAALRPLIQRFIAAKQFWGVEGLAVTDEMKVVVAAYACLLVLRLPHLGLYPRNREVVIYPGAFGDRVEAIGPDGRAYPAEDLLDGEMLHRGPILLAWDSISNRRGRGPVWGEVIIHEFAHALDALDGATDGAPSLDTREAMQEWADVFTREYEALVEADRRGRHTFLDSYGAGNPAEFFAVASEHFFIEPTRLRKRHPELYDQLVRFYRQDPAGWRPGQRGWSDRS